MWNGIMQSSMTSSVKLEQCASIPVHLNERNGQLTRPIFPAGAKKCGLGARLDEWVPYARASAYIGYRPRPASLARHGSRWRNYHVLRIQVTVTPYAAMYTLRTEKKVAFINDFGFTQWRCNRWRTAPNFYSKVRAVLEAESRTPRLWECFYDTKWCHSRFF